MDEPNPNEEKRSILSDVDRIIDDHFSLDIGERPHYRHKESCIKLLKSPLLGIEMLSLIEKMYEQIKTNWSRSEYHNPSRENWRFEKQELVGSDNKKEVALERALVNIPGEIWPDADSWVNQVPVASGLVDPAADKRRAIDLVYRCKDDSYDFIELKVDESGGTPLFAAMEVLQYGLLYVFPVKTSNCLTN